MTIRRKALGLTAVAVAAALALGRLQQHRWPAKANSTTEAAPGSGAPAGGGAVADTAQ